MRFNSYETQPGEVTSRSHWKSSTDRLLLTSSFSLEQ